MDERLLRLLVAIGVPAVIITLVYFLIWLGAIWAGVDAVQKIIAHLHVGKAKIPPPARGVVTFLLTSPWVGIFGVGALYWLFFRRLGREVRNVRRTGDFHEHDTVIWRDTGRTDTAGMPVLDGPYCPDCPRDSARPLMYENSVGRDVAVDTDLANTAMSALFCPACRVRFTTSSRPKRIGDSRREVASNLQGRRVAHK